MAEKIKSPNFSVYCPTVGRVEEARQILHVLRRALGANNEDILISALRRYHDFIMNDYEKDITL